MAVLDSLKGLLFALSGRRRLQLTLLPVLMLVSAMAELVTIGAILPFLAVLVDPKGAMQMPMISAIATVFGDEVAVDDLRRRLTMLFVAAAASAGIIRFFLSYAISRLNFGIAQEIGREVFRRTLYQSYETHVSRNSSETMGAIHKVDEAVHAIHAVLIMIGALMVVSLIVVALLLSNPQLVITALAGIGGTYALIFIVVHKRLVRNSQVISAAFSGRTQAVQEGLGGIRDILLDHAQPHFVNRFGGVDRTLRQAQASNGTVVFVPRYAVETIGMILIALLAYDAVRSNGVSVALPALGALALGAQRLLPLVQQVYQGWVQVSGNVQVLHDVASLLRQPIREEDVQLAQTVVPLPFKYEIRFERVSFCYKPHLPHVLHDVTFVLPKGTRTGFMGTTGSGKSTIMDLLMGLLQPTSGQILVDGTPLSGTARMGWQRNIAHVPQAIYLADASFSENIAFGMPAEQIDLARVEQAARQAQIADFIESTPSGYKTRIGERGVLLSGGQRQRIGIARALYKQADVIIFDEATSALDNETEQAVMQAIEGLSEDLTILIIAHRLTTLRNCTQIVELGSGGILRIGSYQDVIEKASDRPRPHD